MSAYLMEYKTHLENGKKEIIELLNKMKINNENYIMPGLAIIMIGDNPASQVYVNSIIKDCKDVGISTLIYNIPEDVDADTIVDAINVLNNLDNITGIMLQLPLPDTLKVDKNKIINSIDPKKDIDGITKKSEYTPCTPLGIKHILNTYKIDLKGKDCVIIGKGDTVGKPLFELLIDSGATVTCCHSQTKDLKYYCVNADIIISAVGKEKLITVDMVKPNAIIIDAGITKGSDGKICGDVDFENVVRRAWYITPVPGGVGLSTRLALLYNLVESSYLYD